MTNKKPLICVSADMTTTDGGTQLFARVSHAYGEAIYRAGGMPLVTGGVGAEDLAQLCDGLLLSGGIDLHPRYYGEELLNDTVAVCLERDEFEWVLLRAFLEQGKPVFGICRGCQLINVALGGTLYQDLAEQMGVEHRDAALRHEVAAEAGSVLHHLFGPRFLTNSTHHQSVRQAAPGLRVVARSDDGVVEALEHETLPILATQFHPERLTGALREEGVPDFAPLFTHFVELCK